MINATHWEKLAAMAPAEVVRRAQARYDEATGEYTLRILTDDLSVSPAQRTVRWADSARATEKPPSFNHWLVAVVYLLSAREVAPKGDWTTAASFPYGEFFFRGPHALPTQAIADAFGRDPGRFEAAARQLGGEPWRQSSRAFVLPALPRVPVLVQLWEADEEFPARANMLFDRTAGEQVAVDVLWSLSMVVVKALVNVRDFQREIPTL